MKYEVFARAKRRLLSAGATANIFLLLVNASAVSVFGVLLMQAHAQASHDDAQKAELMDRLAAGDLTLGDQCNPTNLRKSDWFTYYASDEDAESPYLTDSHFVRQGRLAIYSYDGSIFAAELTSGADHEVLFCDTDG